jgi:integrase
MARDVRSYNDLESCRKKLKTGEQVKDHNVPGLGYQKQGERMFARFRYRGKKGTVTKSWPMPTYDEMLAQAVAAGRASPKPKSCTDAEDLLERVRAEARAARNNAKSGLAHSAPVASEESRAVEELARQFALVKFPKVKETTAKTMQGHLDRVIILQLGKRSVASVTRQDIATMHASLAAIPFQANRVASTARQLFALAVEWGWRADNPAQRLALFPEPERERWFSDDELARLGEVLDRYPDNPSAQAIKLLALTGARKMEVLGAKWSELHGLDGDKPTWTIPAIRTKKAKSIVRHLDPVTVELLNSIPTNGPLLFPSPVDPKKPLGDIKRFWRRVKREAGIEEGDGREAAVIHTLRHTVASHIVSDGGELLTARDQLGQSSLKSTQRYAKLASGKMRETMTGFSKKLGNGGKRKVS